MALFAIQLDRVVPTSLWAVQQTDTPAILLMALNLVYGIQEMLNVIIRSVYFYFFCFTDDIYLDRASHQQ